MYSIMTLGELLSENTATFSRDLTVLTVEIFDISGEIFPTFSVSVRSKCADILSCLVRNVVRDKEKTGMAIFSLVDIYCPITFRPDEQ